jgi:hypothetical protein
MLFKRTISIAEHVLQPGQDVYVWGRVVGKPHDSDRYDRQILPKLMSDRPKSSFYAEIALFCILGSLFVLVGLAVFINTLLM